MINLLVAKEYIKNFYGKYEVYLVPLLKFLLALITLTVINNEMGYMTRIDNISIVLMAALVYSFMSKNFIVVISALFIALHGYEISLECGVIVLAVFLLMFLLYFRFTPKDTIMVIIIPLLFSMNIPYVIPIAVGLLGSPISIITVSCGVVTTYMIRFFNENISTLSAIDTDSTVAKFQFIIDGLLDNREMYVVMGAFVVTVLIVYLVRKLPVDYAWTIAVVAGLLVDIVVLLIGDFTFDLQFSIGSLVLGSILALSVGIVIQFFMFNLDYNRTETVQFEDDEYYYYVKAVPKISVAAPEKKVQKINTQKKVHNAKIVKATQVQRKSGTRTVVVKHKKDER